MKKNNYTNTTTRYKRESIIISFDKSGITYEWRLLFHSGRLRTNKVIIDYNQDVYLKTNENCRSLDDVLKFLENYAFTKKSVKVIDIQNIDDQKYYQHLKSIINFPLDINKLNGSVYFGLYRITLAGNSVRFVYRGIYNDGTHFFTGKFDLLKTVRKFLPNLLSDIEFLNAVKKIEIQN